MGLNSTTIAYNLVKKAKEFRDFFYADAQDVTFKYKDINGNIITKTVPNVAKITAELNVNGIAGSELAALLEDYYTMSGVDGLITALSTELKDYTDNKIATKIEDYYTKSDSDSLLTTLKTELNTNINTAITTANSYTDNEIATELEDVYRKGDIVDESNNTLKFEGKNLFATLNDDDTFNDDGIFKIKEVDGEKKLIGVLDVTLFSIPVITTSTVDIFGDGKSIALFEFENNAADTGGIYNGAATDGITYIVGKFGFAVESSGSYQVRINNLPFNSDTDTVTVSSWVKWNGNNAVMAFGWNICNIYFYSGNLGFNTGNNDVYGISNDVFRNMWRHLVVEFTKGAYGKIWVDGVPQSLTQKQGSINTSKAVMGDMFNIFGWGANTGYRNFGMMDQVRIFSRALTNDEVQTLYTEKE